MDSFTPMETINLVATLVPKPGKSERIIELLTNMAKLVKENEPGTTNFQIFVQPETGNVVTIEIFNDKAANAAHCSTKAFEELYRTIEEEGLAAKPVDLVWLRNVAGFAAR